MAVKPFPPVAGIPKSHNGLRRKVATWYLYQRASELHLPKRLNRYHPPMPRTSNLGRGPDHSNRTHVDAPTIHGQASIAPSALGLHTPNANAAFTMASFGRPPGVVTSGNEYAAEIHGVAASATGRDSSRSGAPLGVGGTLPRQAGEGRAAARVLARGEKPRTGATVLSATGRLTIVLTGSGGKHLRASREPMTREQARKVAERLRKGAKTAGARVLMGAAGSLNVVCSKDAPERTRSVLRWTKRLTGISHGINGVRAGLQAFGLWKGVQRAAKRAG